MLRKILACRYKKMDYALAVAITAGVSLFFLTGQVSSVQAKTDSRTALAWGAFLMLGYLGFDGFTSTFQDSLFKGYSMSTYNQMLYVNAFSSLVSLFGEPQVPSELKTLLWGLPLAYLTLI